MGQTSTMLPRMGALVAYGRSQVTAVVATAIDFCVLIALVELVGIYYVLATCIGAVCGGIVAFLMNRSWSFVAAHGRIDVQALRYSVVWVGSIVLNTGLVYALTEVGLFPYQASKLVTAVAVGTLFNFPLHRYFCFGAPPPRQMWLPSSVPPPSEAVVEPALVNDTLAVGKTWGRRK